MTTVIMFKLKHSASLSAGMPQEGKLYLCNRATGMVAGALLCSFTLKAFLRFSSLHSLFFPLFPAQHTNALSSDSDGYRHHRIKKFNRDFFSCGVHLFDSCTLTFERT